MVIVVCKNKKHGEWEMVELLKSPRKINLSKTFESLVDWVCDQSKAERAPGLIVGISGTDSILTFLVCAEAFKRLGKQNRVIGVHFGLDEYLIKGPPITKGGEITIFKIIHH